MQALISHTDTDVRVSIPELSEAATDVVRHLLEGTAAIEARCDVRRRDDGLHVHVIVEPPLPAAARGMVATRIHQRLRDLDPWCPSITTSVRSRTTDAKGVPS